MSGAGLQGKFLTIIIPTWNMGRYLPPLVESIIGTPLAEITAEIIFVCDKSTDGSEEIIERMAEDRKSLPSIRLVQPESRQGLFYARYLGAKEAKTPKIMYIDSRITLSPRTTRSLPGLLQTYPAMSAIVDIDEKKDLYSLYWKRSHHRIFSRTAREMESGFTVSAENFSQYRIGGTCFVCSRDLLVSISERYLGRTVSSDDTLVMRQMVEAEPFSVHPDFRINWEPRDKWWPFVKHLFYRGPGFAEYHIFEHRGWLFWAVLSGFIGLIAVGALLFVKPCWAVGLLAGSVLAIILSTALFAKSISEFFRMAILHTFTVLAYGLGAIRGIYVIFQRRRRA